MSMHRVYLYLAVVLLLFPLATTFWKVQQQPDPVRSMMPKHIYQVSYVFDLFNLPEEAFVKAYIPQSNERQIIDAHPKSYPSISSYLDKTDSGVTANWLIHNRPDAVIKYDFEVETKSIEFTMPKEMPFEEYYPDSLTPHLQPTTYIQSDHDSIVEVANSLKGPDLAATLKANYTLVNRFTSSNMNALTDAVTTLKRQRGSCNGKSRLFVALCRAQGIPARVVGGIILANEEKRTSHLWTEVYYKGHWIPFDPLNGHFAVLPAHYLELYKGDEFLITHTKGVGFDYQFVIKQWYQSRATAANHQAQLWPLLTTAGIPLGLLRGILLLPLAALIIAIFKNVVGLKTFGIFLPALIALALVKVDLSLGLGAFAVVIIVVSLLHLPLERLGLLHTPKLVIMLTCVVITLLALSTLGIQEHWETLTATLFLPVVVLAITAERFAKTLVEDNLEDAVKMLGSTFFIAFLCYPLFKLDLLVGLFLTYPELYLVIVGIMIFLGRWIGFRVMEYQRFQFVLKA